MPNVCMQVKQVADLVGISVRTLHHYDAIGLLVPSGMTKSGYRQYSEKDLETLQHILFFRELGFPLKEIKNMLDNPKFDQLEALSLQRKMLLEKRQNVDKMITTIEKTIKHMKGDVKMTQEEKFDGLNFSHNPYEQEARERWGHQSVDQANAKLEKLSKKEQGIIAEKWNMIFRELADLRDENPGSHNVQAAIQSWYDFLNKHIHTYSLEAFKGLGQLYVEDERFTKNIDKYGNGLAQFMRDAMSLYVEQHKKNGNRQ